MLSGTFAEWPQRVWTDDPGVSFEAGEGRGQFRVNLSAGARLGPHLVRFYGTAGCSVPCLFVVGDRPESVEFGSVERQGAGEMLPSLPWTVNGRLVNAGEVDAYQFALESGQVLQADLVAGRLDSPLQARLRLVAPDGETVVTTTNRPPADPYLEARVRASGSHRLLIEATPALAPGSAAEPTGSAGFYRLELRTLAAPRSLPAPGVVLYQSPEVPGVEASVVVRADAEWASPQHPETLLPSIELPASLTGFINPAGDEDRFSFQAHHDEVHHFVVQAGTLGSPLAPVLRVLDGSQRVLAQAREGLDLALDWVAPWDGSFTLTVGDAGGGGGAEFRYALEMSAPEPRLAAEVSAHTWRALPGGEVSFSVKLRRPPTHRRVLTVSPTGLPRGVSAVPGLIPPDGSETQVRLQVEPDTAPLNTPFQLTLLDVSAPPIRILTGRAPLRGRHAPAGNLLLNETETLWLTVLPAQR